MSEAIHLPKHIAIVMDGNGRWAEAQGLRRFEGHRAGTDAALDIVAHCRKLGIAHLTLYTFSTENWKRPEAEKKVIFDLLITSLTRELSRLLENDIQIRVLGDVQPFPHTVKQVLKMVQAKTKKCSSMILNLALNYGGRDEIVHAIRSICKQKIAPEDISAETVAHELYTAGQPDPDLVIRTSGELRLSNYLLWQSAYAELYFTQTLWPDFSTRELDKALASYAERQRRFGKTGAQIKGEAIA